jgi:hypothetical protein
MKSLETQIAELNESIGTKDAEIARLQAVIAEADKTVAAAKLADMCKEAELPTPAIEKLKAAFATAINTNGMQEAVNTEKKYIASLGIKEAVKIVRNNAGQPVQEGTGNVKELKESQKKAFIACGYDEKTANAMAGIE